MGIYEYVWYIYRCALESKCGSTEDKHRPETLEKVLEKAEERFKTWKTTAKSDVGITLNDPIWIYNLNELPRLAALRYPITLMSTYILQMQKELGCINKHPSFFQLSTLFVIGNTRHVCAIPTSE